MEQKFHLIEMSLKITSPKNDIQFKYLKDIKNEYDFTKDQLNH